MEMNLTVGLPDGWKMGVGTDEGIQKLKIQIQVFNFFGFKRQIWVSRRNNQQKIRWHLQAFTFEILALKKKIFTTFFLRLR
jgi:hypothetical protein